MNKKEFIDTALQNLEDILQVTIGKKPRNDQKAMVRGLGSTLLTNNMTFPPIAQTIEAPNGAGKSFVILAIAVTYAAYGKKVLLVVPNYRLIDMYEQYLQDFQLPTKEYVQLKPFTKFTNDCELDTEKKPDIKRCAKWKTKCLETTCPVMQHLQKVELRNIVITTQHKMVYDSSLLTGKSIGIFDLVLIDEFHMIPEVIEQFINKSVPLDTLIERATQIESIDSELKAEIADMWSDYLTASDGKGKKAIVDDFYNLLQDEELEDKVLDQGRKSVTPNGIRYRQQIKEKYLPNTQFGLFSATVIDTKYVVYDLLKIDGINIAPKLEYYNDSKKRLQRISIFGTTDLPRLKKGNKNEYAMNRQRTTEYLVELLTTLTKEQVLSESNILILCNSHAEAKYVREQLHNAKLEHLLLDVDEVQRKIEAQYYDSDQITQLVNENVSEILKNGYKILLVTGSSVFWQGVNLDNVKFLFIFSLPYRPPTATELESARSGWTGHFSSTAQFHYMIRKLSQGIGRLCRTDTTVNAKGKEIKNWGFAIVLDGRFESARTSIIKQFPQVYHDRFFYFTSARLSAAITNAVKHCIKFGSPYNKQGQLSLNDFEE